MTRLTLDAGACGFKAVVEAKKTGRNRFRIELVSPCEMIKELNEELKDKDFGPEVFRTIESSEIYRLCSKHIRHVSCPLPSAILKAIEVEAGLAIPKDVRMDIER